MTTLSVEAARKVCEIGLTVIPVFALAFLVSERDKLRVRFGNLAPPGESPEESMERGRYGSYTISEGSVTFTPGVDPSDAFHLAVILPFLLASVTGFFVALIGLLTEPGPFVLSVVSSCLLLIVFIFFSQVATSVVQSSFTWSGSEKTRRNSVWGVLRGTERILLKSTQQDITGFERLGYIAIGAVIFLVVAGLIALIAVNVLIIGFVDVT
jgi:hypothetical protein